MGSLSVPMGSPTTVPLFPYSMKGFGTPRCCSCPRPWGGQRRASYRMKVWGCEGPMGGYGVGKGGYGVLWGG